MCNFIDDLLKESSSFVYGQNPSKGPVPVYAMISMCDPTTTEFNVAQQNGTNLFRLPVTIKFIY